MKWLETKRPPQAESGRSAGAPATPEGLLEVRSVTKCFGGLVALKDVSLSIPRGIIAGLIGPNGSGKTTLFNCITGFYRPDSGAVLFEGQRIDRLTPHEITARGIARTFQNIRLFGAMTALENVLVGMHHTIRVGLWGALLTTQEVRREEERATREAVGLLHFVGLRGRENAIARNLPYGDQRRLEVARALAARPKLLLLDEPTAGMNPRESAAIVTLIRRLREEFGLTVLLIEHQMRVVMGVCEQITVLDYGEKIAEGDAGAVQRDPRVIEAYLGKGMALRYDAPDP